MNAERKLIEHARMATPEYDGSMRPAKRQLIRDLTDALEAALAREQRKDQALHELVGFVRGGYGDTSSYAGTLRLIAEHAEQALAAVPVETQDSLWPEIIAERGRQDRKWGGPDHDDSHGWVEWLDYIDEHNRKAYPSDDSGETRRNFRQRMIEVAALAVAAVESLDRQYVPAETQEAAAPDDYSRPGWKLFPIF